MWHFLSSTYYQRRPLEYDQRCAAQTFEQAELEMKIDWNWEGKWCCYMAIICVCSKSHRNHFSRQRYICFVYLVWWCRRRRPSIRLTHKTVNVLQIFECDKWLSKRRGNELQTHKNKNATHSFSDGFKLHNKHKYTFSIWRKMNSSMT